MYATGENLTSSELADNETSTQLRLGIKKQRLRDRVEKLDESLSKDLSRYAKIDAQRAYAQGVNINAISESLNAQTGITINLIDKKANTSISSVIILKITFKAEFPNALDEYVEDMADTKEAQYSVEFDAIPSEIIYKPDTSIDKPRIYSLQTAIVSNANKETSKYANQIDVNEKGEIRVIFHFDKEKTTSVYIPLANIYSGDGYGSQFLPRVNSQVLVSYINGDIDRPIITGALHNAQNRYAYNLPKEKTKSFIKTQTTPQYEDKEGYNELLFEDKQGEELLSLRAQNDYKLQVLNDSHTHIHNDTKTVIDKDKELTVANDFTQTIGSDKKVNIVGNAVTTIEKEQITTVKEDKELHLLQDANTIISKNKKTIVEKELIQRIKGSVTHYTEQDQKEKYLTNLFMQVGKDLGIEITNAYHLNAKSIKQSAAKTIEIEAANGISLKCGGNVLTVDASGIYLKGATVDSDASNGGVTAPKVQTPEIKKPLYNKLRVTALNASITKQDDITQTLTYTAKVQKYENGTWTETTELNAAQHKQINWHFIKNNDKANKDILTDNPTDDIIHINGLEMSITLNKENIYQYGHAHAFVADSKKENGHAVSELKRQLEVVDIIASDDKYRAVLNVNKITKEEESEIRWNINKKEKPQLSAKESISYDLKEEKVRDVVFKAYIEGKPEDGAVITVSNDVKSETNKDEEIKKEENT